MNSTIEVVVGCYFFPLNSCSYEVGNYRGLIIVAHHQWATIIKLVTSVCVSVCVYLSASTLASTSSIVYDPLSKPIENV